MILKSRLKGGGAPHGNTEVADTHSLPLTGHSPLKEAIEGGRNDVWLHGLQSVNACYNECLQLITRVEGWLSVEQITNKYM